MFLGSLVAFGYANTAKDPLAGDDWAALDYVAFAMFVASLGCTLAVIKLKDDNEDS